MNKDLTEEDERFVFPEEIPSAPTRKITQKEAQHFFECTAPKPVPYTLIKTSSALRKMPNTGAFCHEDMAKALGDDYANRLTATGIVFETIPSETAKAHFPEGSAHFCAQTPSVIILNPSDILQIAAGEKNKLPSGGWSNTYQFR